MPINRFSIFAIVSRIFAWYCDTVLTFVTYELITIKRGMVDGGGENGVGGQTVKNIKVGPWGT